MTSSTQTTSGVGYTLGYGYDLADRVISQTYPSGRVVTTHYDVGGRVFSVSDPGRNYAHSFTYPSSTETRFRYGNGLYETAVLSGTRRQPRWIKLGLSPGSAEIWQLENGYGGSSNNGNIGTQLVTVPGALFTVSYTYDALNRLQTASESSTIAGSTPWSHTYAYDRWGNAAATGTPVDPVHTPQSLSAFNTTTNRINSLGYDAAGNLTTDAAGRNYDAENRQTSAPGASYTYDGEGSSRSPTRAELRPHLPLLPGDAARSVAPADQAGLVGDA